MKQARPPAITRLTIVPMALLLPVFLLGCGQRGPLYLPDEPAAAVAPAQASPAEDTLESELDRENDLGEDDLEDGNLQSDSFEGGAETEDDDAP